MLEVLGLVKIPTEKGTLFLYPEYVDQADRFILPAREKNKAGGTRHPEIVTAYDGTQYVAKKERAADDKFMVDFSKKVPEHGNMAAKEVSIARALSKLAEFEDDIMAVRFEKSYGYFEDNNGQRTALFQYESRIKDAGARIPKEVRPSELQEIIDTLRPIEFRRRERHPHGAKLGCVNIVEEGKNISNEYYYLEKMISELYVPQYFAGLTAITNGVHNNEIEIGYFRDNEGRSAAFMLDFEFSSMKKDVEDIVGDAYDYFINGIRERKDICMDSLAQIMGDHTKIDQMEWIKGEGEYATRGESLGTALKRRLSEAVFGPKEVLDPVKSEALMQDLRQRVAAMDARIRDYTGLETPEGFRPGPAYDHIKFLAGIKDPSELVLK